MADAGDFIGLPDREVRKILIDQIETQIKRTIYCPPEWFPLENKPTVLFLDEVNRGKPEINQVLMNVLLNKKLNTFSLPEQCIIIGAINPNNGVYQTELADPAWYDRWNIYDFLPTAQEWLDWAIRKGLDENVISFISKNNDQLDPADVGEDKVDMVQASRRSWHRVSNSLKLRPDVSEHLLKNYLIGVVGDRSMNSFVKFLKENRNNLHANTIITQWSKKIQEKIKTLNIQDTEHLNTQIVHWFENNQEKVISDKKLLSSYTQNLEKYIEAIQPESMASLMTKFIETHSKTGKMSSWVNDLLNSNVNIAKKYQTILIGENDKMDDWK
jgi:hypothetical protein